MKLGKCGCGRPTKFNGGVQRRLLWGHAMRVNQSAVRSMLGVPVAEA